MKHLNLLKELSKTEKDYIQDLFIIINSIAGVYNPNQLPPNHLDHHFRLIEFIFRSHKNLQNFQNDQDLNLNLKDFVHFFNSFILNLTNSYNRYCHPNGWAGKGGWSRDPTINSNSNLIQTLKNLNWPHSLFPPPPNQPYSPFPDAPYTQDDLLLYDSNYRPHASLTLHFSLPFIRLIYYRKLSQNLIQLIHPNNQSDLNTVINCSHQLDLLIDKGHHQWNLSPLQLLIPSKTNQISSLQSPDQYQKLDRPSIQPPPHNYQPQHQNLNSLNTPPLNSLFPTTHQSPTRNFSPVQAVPLTQQFNSLPSVPNGHRVSSENIPTTLANSNLGHASHQVFDRNIPSTPLSSSSATSDAGQQIQSSKSDLLMVPVSPGVFIQQAILDFQAQLHTSHCLDIFTMMPKQCRLHLAPPTLAYSRSIRFSGEAKFQLPNQLESNRTQSAIQFDPNLINGKLILITDLLLFCEYKIQSSPKSNQLSLMFPPLTGKHLQVSPVQLNSHFCFDVTTMNKSVIRVFVSNVQERNAWIRHIENAFEFCNQITIPNHVSHANPLQTVSPIGEQNSGSQPTIKPISSHYKSAELPRQHMSSSSIPIDRQLSQLDLSCCKPLQEKSPSTSTTQTHHSSFQPLSSNSIGAHLEKLHSSSSSHRVQSGFSQLSTRSAILPNSVEQRKSQDRGPPLNRLKKMQSAQALGAHYSQFPLEHPPMPLHMRPSYTPSFDPHTAAGPSSIISMHHNPIVRSTSTEPYQRRHYRPPSTALLHQTKTGTLIASSNLSQTYDFSAGSVMGSDELSPESADELDEKKRQEDKLKELETNTKTTLVATLKSKVFKKQSHSQWKSLGAAKIQVFSKNPGNFKQLVVFDIKNPTKIWISTIVLSDGIERVGKTGVAVDLSDHGVRTGIVYMLQLKNETSAHGLFEQLLEGSDRRPK